MNRPTNCRRNSLTPIVVKGLVAMGGFAIGAAAFAQSSTTPPEDQTQHGSASQTYESSTQSTTREWTSTHAQGQAPGHLNRERVSEDEERTTTSSTQSIDRDRASSQGVLASSELKTMDRDGDGSVSLREHEAAARQEFARIDADGDGSVTAAELQAGSMSNRSTSSSSSMSSSATGAPASASIAAVDQNADGKLTADEHAQASRDMFGQLDGDRDGVLSQNEIQMGRDISRTTQDPSKQQ